MINLVFDGSFNQFITWGAFGSLLERKLPVSPASFFSDKVYMYVNLGFGLPRNSEFAKITRNHIHFPETPGRPLDLTMESLS